MIALDDYLVAIPRGLRQPAAKTFPVSISRFLAPMYPYERREANP